MSGIDDGIHGFDDQELQERSEAAQALAVEDPRHLVDWVLECVKESRQAKIEISYVQEECWKAYCQQMNWSNKEDWQSKIANNDPLTAVERAAGIIHKSLKNPDYFSVEGFQGDKAKPFADFVREAIRFWTNEQHCNLPINGFDAARMGFITGQSMEVIPRWDPNIGLILDLIEPWKIDRDPDAFPRQPWSGLFHVHSEWIDLWKIKEREKDGYYSNTDEVRNVMVLGEDKEKAERRKNQWWKRSNYRQATIVRQFHGTVLDNRGDLLLKSCKMTIAGDTLVRAPEPVEYVRMRWPGVSFSPIPDLLRYDGRGIIEGALQLWWAHNNVLSLGLDHLSWLVNKMREIFPDLLMNPGDLDFYPGKDIFRNGKNPDQSAVKEVTSASTSADWMAIYQLLKGEKDNAQLTNQFVQGLPGSRSNITKGEVEIKTEQSLGIFEPIGWNIEQGLVSILWAIFETIVLQWDRSSNPRPTEAIDLPFSILFEILPFEQKKELLRQNCYLQISGISGQLNASNTLERLFAIMARATQPQWGKYIEPYLFLKDVVETLGFHNAKWLADSDKAKEIDDRLANALANMSKQTIPPEIGGGNGGAGIATPVEAGGGIQE